MSGARPPPWGEGAGDTPSTSPAGTLVRARELRPPPLSSRSAGEGSASLSFDSADRASMADLLRQRKELIQLRDAWRKANLSREGGWGKGQLRRPPLELPPVVVVGNPVHTGDKGET